MNENKLSREQLNHLSERIDLLLDYMEEAGDEKFVSLCLVYDHLQAARDLLDAQEVEHDRDSLERCFSLGLK